MERITIEMADDGQITITAESPGEELETMDVASPGEAADAVRELLVDAADDAAAMWDEEASRRPPQPGLMT
jgi:hypothetical protein